MCGRFTLARELDVQFIFRFSANDIKNFKPRYNIAPTQQIPAVISGTTTISSLRWGLIPSWAKDISIGNRMINARAESLSEKPSFKKAFSERRCLILADGFYEWKKDEKKKQPFYIRMKGGRTFCFAGLWERWTSHEGEVIESATIITTEANDLIKPIHDRMPVIIKDDEYSKWLDSNQKNTEELKKSLVSYSSDSMEVIAVSDFVNKPTHDSEKCIEAISLG